MSCLGDIGSNFVKKNAWSVNTLQIGLFVAGYWDDYPNHKKVMLAFFGLSLAVILGGFAYLTTVYVRHKGKYLVEGDEMVNADPEMWRRLQVSPLLILAWQLTIDLILITLLLEGFSTGTAEAVQMGAWVEFLLALDTGSVILGNPFTVTWRKLLGRYVGILVGYLVNQFLMGSTANIYIQVLLSLITVVGDLGQGLFTTAYAYNKHYSISRYGDTINTSAGKTAWFHSALALNHLLAFGLPVIFCSYITFAAYIMTILAGVNLVLVIGYLASFSTYLYEYIDAGYKIPAVL